MNATGGAGWAACASTAASFARQIWKLAVDTAPSRQKAAMLLPLRATLYVSASQIALLIEVAALAIQDFNAQLAVNEDQMLYLDRITEFERKHDRIDGRLDPRNPDHVDVVAFTKPYYDAYQRSRRAAYNARRRLANACRKARFINAGCAQEGRPMTTLEQNEVSTQVTTSTSGVSKAGTPALEPRADLLKCAQSLRACVPLEGAQTCVGADGAAWRIQTAPSAAVIRLSGISTL
jgi:hypothetical protein